MPSHVIKMKANLPAHVEARLVNKWGFAVERRVHGDYVLFKKSYISDKNDEGVKRTIRASVNKPTTITPINLNNVTALLTPHQKKALAKRCDNIVAMFPDPYAVPMSIRTRLQVISQRMTLQEAQFVLEYMDEHFPIIDEGK